ncbi:hypothetical protein HK098_006234 [Nowakowskiella sp. JEL0407]|nr:hypothetical protein HK098_006234 [Nowakowskiella sp. JEL0407]
MLLFFAFFLLNFFCKVFAASSLVTSDSIYIVSRYDNNPSKPWEKRSVLKLLNSQSLNRDFSLQTITPTVIPNPFNFVSQCQTSNQQSCNSAIATLKIAAQKITQSLSFFHNISVSVQLVSACETETKEACTDPNLQSILGGAAPASYFEAKRPDDDRYFAFPQALIRQLEITDNVVVPYNTYDIIAVFNMDANWWYSSTGTPIGKDQYDFERVAIHELTHGLGFDTTINQWRDVYKYLGPSYHLLNDTIVTGWLPPTAMDKHIVQTSTKTRQEWLDFHTRITRFAIPKPISESNFLQNFAKSGDPYNAAIELYNLCTSKERALMFSDGTAIPVENDPDAIFLQTYPLTYRQGSSIAHVDQTMYTNSSEFLMTPAVAASTTNLTVLLARYNSTVKGPYGLKTLNILQNLGYSLKGSESRVKVNLRLVKSEVGSTSAARRRWKSGDLVVVAIVVSLILGFL